MARKPASPKAEPAAAKPAAPKPDPRRVVIDALFRLAAILQGIVKRAQIGTASSSEADTQGDAVTQLADLAMMLTAVLVAGLAFANVRGLRFGARIVEWSTAAKLVPLLFFVLVGAWFTVAGIDRI